MKHNFALSSLASVPHKLSLILLAWCAAVAPAFAADLAGRGGSQDAQVAPAENVLVSAAGDAGAATLFGMNNNEPTIAMDPHNPSRIAVATYLGIRVSTNGGATFQPRVNMTAPSGFSTGSGGDSSLGYDSQGRLFWTFLLRTVSTGGFDVFVAQCNPTNGAILSGYPVNLTAAAGVTNDNSTHSHDKSWLAVDASPISPFKDRLYAVWSDFQPGGTAILSTYSTNQGANWSPALTLSGAGEGFVWPSQNTVATNGDVYAAYHSQPTFSGSNPDGLTGKIFVLRSTNGAVAFPQKNLAYGAGQADMTFNVQNGTRKIPKAQFWLQGSTQPQILTDPKTNGRLYVIANDQPDPTNYANVYIVISTNYGSNWSSPGRIDSGPNTTFHVMPSAAIDPVTGMIVVSYYDNRNNNTNAAGNYLLDVFATRSENAGVSFSPDFQISSNAFNPDLNAPCRFDCSGPVTNKTLRIGEYNGIVVGGGMAAAVWTGNDGSSLQDTLFSQFPAIPLPIALDAANLNWSSGGTLWWAGETNVTHDGVDAAQSGAITNNQNSYIETTVPGPGTLSFWWKVSSEPGFDYLRFFLDGVEQAGAPAISGEVDWQQKTIAVPAGSHALRWTYTKDVSLSVGSDAGWVDQVVVIPTVANTNDSGPNSLRQVIADVPAGTTIAFAANLSGQSITLTNGELLLNKNLTLDASTLPGGLAINGRGASRIFNVAGGTTVVLDSLTLTNGAVVGSGGAIYNAGALTVNRCSLAGNSATSFGGGIENDGALTVNQCTLTANSCQSGGGAAIDHNSGSLAVNQSTVSGNTATAGGGSGGVWGSGWSLNNSVVAGNTAPTFANISGSIITTGVNLTNGLPLLAPLGYYGGPTPTMLPLPGSPAIDAAGASSFTTDQRGAGFARVVNGAPDIGAVESGNTISGFNSIVTDNTDTFNGLDNGAVSLREAVVLSAAGSTITFATNLSGAIITLTNGQLVLNKNLNVDASALAAGIQINGNHASRVFEVNGGNTCVITALTITNAFIASGFGAGVESYGDLTLNNCRVVGNRSGETAGGITAAFGSLTLNQTTVSGNTCDNVAGIYLQDELATIRDCTISGNSGSAGEGLRVGSAFLNTSVTLINTTVSGNLANSFNSGIQLSASAGLTCAVLMTNCTVASNLVTTAGSPGGIWLKPGAGTNRLTLYNSIVSGNTSGGAAADITGAAETNSAFNLIGTGGGLVNGVNGNQVGINNPLLGSLANNGGPTFTMLPLLGSPAIDAGGTTALTADQRGLLRPAGAAPDIGAVELQISPIVLTSADSGYGSLRYAITYNPAGSTLIFAGGLSGSTILLTTGQLLLNKNLNIDASSLVSGISISGNHSSRAFQVNAGVIASLTALAIRDGNAGTAAGGGIFNQGTLALTNCTVAGNTAGNGGGIANSGGTMTANQCTLSGNSATLNNGGGLADPSGTVTLNQCTVVGNTTVLQGGGIAFQGTVAVNQCTITANTAQGTGGGGIWRNNTGALTLFNSIVAGNTQSSGNDVNSSVTTYSGVNLTNGAPLLAPLGNYGGPTPTMPPFPGSPAVDAGGATSFTTDQRGAGFPRVINGAPDIGAVEGVFNPPIALTGPTRLGNGTFQFGFTNYAGVSFTVLSSTNVTLPLNNWTVLGVPLEISPGQYQITDPQATNSPQKFYRVGAGHLSNLRWASRVLGFSSQYTTGGWSAAQALGQPDTYPLYGDFQWAWATAVTDDPNEYLELGFDPPAPVSSVSIYETFNPGAVSKVSVRNPNTGLWVQVWSGVAAPAPAVARIFTVTFPQTSFPVDAVRLDLDSQLVPDWNEIDAVRINW